MSDTVSTHAVSTQGRGGFWRRTIAFSIDSFLISFVVGLVGLILFAPTGGRIRVSSLGFNSQNCFPRELQTLDGLELSLPADFRPTYVVRCISSLLGYVHDRNLIVAEIKRSGSMTYTHSRDFPVDADGRPMRAFYIDFLSLPLLVGYLVVLQRRFGRTLGMDLMNIRLQSPAGGLPSIIQVAKRLLLLGAPALLFIVVEYLMPLFGITVVTMPTFYWIVLALAGLIAAAITINFILTVRRRDLPWADRFAGTEVVLGR